MTLLALSIPFVVFAKDLQPQPPMTCTVFNKAYANGGDDETIAMNELAQRAGTSDAKLAHRDPDSPNGWSRDTVTLVREWCKTSATRQPIDVDKSAQNSGLKPAEVAAFAKALGLNTKNSAPSSKNDRYQWAMKQFDKFESNPDIYSHGLQPSVVQEKNYATHWAQNGTRTPCGKLIDTALHSLSIPDMKVLFSSTDHSICTDIGFGR